MRLVLLTGPAACVLAALAAIDEWKGAVPPVQPKPYRIGIAPSHVTASPDPLFEPDADWRAVSDKIDFYKYYSLQLSPPKWASRLAVGPFAAFVMIFRFACSVLRIAHLVIGRSLKTIHPRLFTIAKPETDD